MAKRTYIITTQETGNLEFYSCVRLSDMHGMFNLHGRGPNHLKMDVTVFCAQDELGIESLKLDYPHQLSIVCILQPGGYEQDVRVSLFDFLANKHIGRQTI